MKWHMLIYSETTKSFFFNETNSTKKCVTNAKIKNDLMLKEVMEVLIMLKSIILESPLVLKFKNTKGWWNKIYHLLLPSKAEAINGSDIDY